MDFQSAMETFAEAWVAANSKANSEYVNGPQSEALALTTRDREEDAARSPTPRSPTPLTPHHQETPEKAVAGKSLPVHCIVEAVWSVEEWERGWGRPGSGIEADSYVIIPISTSFTDLVPVALSRLGYSRENAAAAKGSVVIKNWKPLTFDKIAESPLMTVGDILGELSTIATLRIQIFRARPSVLTEMKEKLLRLLLVQSHSLLASSGCPIGESMMNQMVRSDNLGEVSEEVRRKFDSWWEKQSARMGRRGPSPWYGSPDVPQISHRPHESVSQASPDKKQIMLANQDENLHPAIQTVQNQYPTQKTRMRTSFDPELELPKLQRWFHENPHPSRQQIQQYVKDLNSLESRRGRKPLDVNNVVYWFKNARAAQKRAEVRTVTPGLAGISMNGYNSSSESPSDMGGIMSKSPGSHEDDDLEEDDRPPSPISLTTRQPHSSSPHTLNDQRPESRENIKTEASEDGHQTPVENNNVINNNNNHPKEEQMDDDEDEEMEETASDIEESKEDKKVFPRADMMSRGGFPMNSMFGQSMLYMGHYIQSLNSTPHQTPPLNLSLPLSLQDERRKRNRTFIDPVSEVPRLEQWFALNTHPSHSLILKYTDDLNRMPYRQKFPPLEPKNVQFWFKNRRAKCKRLKMSLFDQPGSHQPFHLPLPLSDGDPYRQCIINKVDLS